MAVGVVMLIQDSSYLKRENRDLSNEFPLLQRARIAVWLR